MIAATATDLTAGIHDGIPAEVYHRHPALSSSGARKLLPPSCPALFDHDRRNPAPYKREFSFGHAAHKEVLGVGSGVVVVKAKDWRTDAAKAERDEALAADLVPLLEKEWAVVEAMAAALRAHPIAGALFRPGAGLAEQSLFWTDRRTGTDLRARLDWITTQGSGRTLISDYKTTVSAADDDIEKAIFNFGYHMQGDWYVAGAKALGIASRDAAYLLVCQEKTPPYLVNVAQVNPFAMRVGELENRRAIDVYQRCTESGTWPGYGDEVHLLGLPTWVERRYEEPL